MESTFEGNTCFSETCSVLGLSDSDQKFSLGTPRVLLNLAFLLETSIRKNEMLSRTEDHNVTKFNGLKAPVLSVIQYIERISKYTNCSMSCFVVAYIYIQRYMKTHSGICLTSLNIHRLLITSTMIAAKFLDDECENNAHYALVGGVSTGEMNELEIELLFGLEFRLQVTTEVFAQYCQYIQHGGSRRVRQVDPPRSRGQRGRIVISRAATTQGCIAQ